jgi:hypothetical protein
MTSSRRSTHSRRTQGRMLAAAMRTVFVPGSTPAVSVGLTRLELAAGWRYLVSRGFVFPRSG